MKSRESENEKRRRETSFSPSLIIGEREEKRMIMRMGISMNIISIINAKMIIMLMMIVMCLGSLAVANDD